MKIKCPDCGTSYEIKVEALGPEGRSVKCAKCSSRWFVSPEFEKGEIAAEAAAEEASGSGVPEEDPSEKDEADWTADAAEEMTGASEAPQEPVEADDEDEVEDKPAPRKSATSDERKFAADLADEEDASSDLNDIETSAKRPKIIVNPDKFRRDHIGALLRWLSRRNFRRIGGLAIFSVALTACIAFVLMRDSIVKQSPDLASLFQLVGFDVNLRGLEFRNLRTFTEVEDGKRVLVVEGSIRNLLEESNAVPAVRLSIRSSDLQEIYAWTVEPRTKSLNALDETRFRTILPDPPKDASDIQVRFVDRGKRQIVLE